MKLVKFLERKGVIRLFGLGFILAPIFNTYIYLLTHPNLSNRWTSAMFWKVIRNGTTAHQILYVASIIIGAVMLRGSVTAWKFAIILLSGRIAHQVLNFGQEFRSDKFSVVYFLVNLGVLLFIADQLAWKQKFSQIKTPKPMPAEKSVNKKFLIHFEGLGTWGQLMSISDKGIHIRCLLLPSPDLSHREIELCLSQDVVLRTKFVRKLDQDYFFEYVSLDPASIRSLNGWMRRQAA